MSERVSTGLLVDGVVDSRDKQPYVQLSNENGIVCQMSMAQARDVAMNILQMCARTEADAMLLKFFEKCELPENAAASMLIEFREFRYALDQEQIDRLDTGRSR